VRAQGGKLVKLFRKPKSKFYWYDFTVRGSRHRGSTQETKSVRALQVASLKLASVMESTDPLPTKPPVLQEFADRFLDWVNNSRLEDKTRKFYCNGWRLLKATSVAILRIDQITGDCAYSADDDLVFPSMRLKGRKPPRANMLVADHLQPAARKAGIKEPVGFHTLRRTLASALVENGSDIRLVQELLRHSNPGITLDAYARSTTPAKIEAQGWVMRQLLSEDPKAALAKAKPATARTM
jgi:hypothetical protein